MEEIQDKGLPRDPPPPWVSWFSFYPYRDHHHHNNHHHHYHPHDHHCHYNHFKIIVIKIVTTSIIIIIQNRGFSQILNHLDQVLDFIIIIVNIATIIIIVKIITIASTKVTWSCNQAKRDREPPAKGQHRLCSNIMMMMMMAMMMMKMMMTVIENPWRKDSTISVARISLFVNDKFVKMMMGR